ncbi:MAG TPA: VIT1/CCC1 transporter family protein [Parvularculaceae bacterium]|nr:VIT1/CCC1 transporter family protein [Parvularculaceae bacterium]
MLGHSPQFERPAAQMTGSKNDQTRRWRQEKTAAFLTAAAAAAEKDPANKRLFEKLAAEGEDQAAIIARKYQIDRPFSPALRARIVKELIGAFGPRRMKGVLAAMKVRGVSVYSGKMRPGAHPMPTTTEEIGARHKGAGGGALRAAVFGVNDGLVSNTSLVMGMAGAAASNDIVFLTGVAGLLAGAFSMAAGEYVSMKTQREMFEHQIAQEKEELELYPEEEAEELALIYEARGLPLDDARDVAKKLIADPKTALDALAREELGLNPDDLGSAFGAAFWSFVAFSSGAFLPLLPFLVGATTPVPIAAALAGVALFAVGAVMSLFSGRNAFLGGVRMLAIGALAGAATFAIGGLFGVATS